MRAAVYHGAHDVRISEVPEPEPGTGEVLLRVLRSGMCGTDATEWNWFDTRSHGLAGARGLVTGDVIRVDGVHVATIAQEVLLRQLRQP